MTELKWNSPGSRRYEAGVDRGVLYVKDKPGVPWVGLIAVVEKPVGGDPTPYYMDGVKYLNVPSPEDIEGTIEAYASPPEFDSCDGTIEIGSGLFITQQRRHPFGLCYRTGLGNDLSGLEAGYRIHLIYNVLAAPSEKRRATISDDTDLLSLNWSFTTTPIYTGPSLKPTAHVIIDSTRVSEEVLSFIEGVLYGTSISEPRLIGLLELIALFPTLKVVDNGDGTWTATGTDAEIQMLNDSTFQITSDNASYIGENTYTLRSVED